MHWFDKLERKYGHIAVHNLMHYIVGAMGLLYCLTYIGKNFILLDILSLDPNLVMKGQIWRLFTYIFIPPLNSPLWTFITLYFYYLVGSGLEEEWGSFKFNLYYLTGMIGTTLAAFITKDSVGATYLNLSLFLAFAKIYPDFELLLFFIIPVKVKYLAMLNWIFIAFTVLTGSIPLKLAAIASILNYFIFFGKDISYSIKNNKETYHRRKNFKSGLPKVTSIHKCTLCGITEKDDPHMDFRYCSQCEGDYEYCMDHLKNHEHRKKAMD